MCILPDFAVRLRLSEDLDSVNAYFHQSAISCAQLVHFIVSKSLVLYV